MAEFKAFRPDVEVCGAAVLALVEGACDFRAVLPRLKERYALLQNIVTIVTSS
jgi:hypothetical protein